MSILSTIRRIFNFAIRELWSFIKVAFAGAVELALAQIKDVAIVTVAELQNQDMSNEDKRRIAFNRIKTYVTDKGLNIKDSLINLIIEIAVAYIKEKLKK